MGRQRRVISKTARTAGGRAWNLRQCPWRQKYLTLKDSDLIIAVHGRLPSNRPGGYKFAVAVQGP
jgi:hypothetical protein